jgi:transposase
LLTAGDGDGIYRPVLTTGWNILEGAFPGMVLVNPLYVKALAGRKTDRLDAKWLATRLERDDLKGSFIPPREIRELRDLTRLRVHWLEDLNRIKNRIGQLCEAGNIKVVECCQRSVWNQWPAHAGGAGRRQSRRAVDGRLRARNLARKKAQLELADRISAWTVLAEIGTDMTVFGDAAHLASWAALCPGNRESGGRRISGKTRKGNRYVRRVLCHSAWATAHKKDSHLGTLYRRVRSRREEQKAIMPVAHQLITIIAMAAFSRNSAPIITISRTSQR